MKINKKKLYLFLFFVSTLQSNDDLTSGFDSILDNMEEDITFPDYDKEKYTPERTVKAFTRSCSLDPDGILPLQDLLMQDIYKFTHPINQRSLLDYPIGYFFSCLPPSWFCKTWQFSTYAYYNQTSKCNFTKDGTGISSYLNFGIANLIPDLEEFGLDINIPRVLSLFEDLKLQERRAGVMFGAQRRKNNFYLEFRLPLEYLIRNFFLNDAEVREIQAEPIFNDQDPGTDDKEEVHRFAREHLIADRLGFGDTRINIGHIAIDNPRLQFIYGLESTIPTACSIKKGLYGNHFPKNMRIPKLDLMGLLDLVGEDIPQAETQGGEFLVGALDRLSRILLETGLGNNGHIGLGLFTYYDLCVTPKFHFKTRANLEYLFPALEERYYIKRKNPADFARLENPDPNNCEEDLAFIERQLTETFFPMGFTTVVFPGFLFKLSTALTGTMAKYFQIMLGNDIWWQQQESFGKIFAPPAELSQLRKNLAIKPGAFQSKAFGSITYYRHGKCCDWSLSLYGDRTFLRSGIGKDFNLAIRFEMLL
ncbi:MAG: hypothetical protein WDZ41_02105 [Candidatus Babeliales bacterium]